ncbi:uncharacterized protein F4812DRAFT_441014 [Daldinia caldariorum]|uniref:uncharacterized protein n=1 Tax=Daldinia caldariorum TaxID=326644 RepID=UPI002007344A|nr:uncharacterized protein F4812DRAFT_441014 [Daldinia caldariorum]KAI1464932.1 hypothetical protein F4812DRAFT_441014 [Daldinia caldariorum]
MAYFRHDAKEKAKQFIPFLDGELMMNTSLPICSAAVFKKPQLRKCPFDLTAIDLKRSRLLDGGFDGFVWKIRLQNKAYALKVFWDAAPPEYEYHFAAQRECQNAALLQMMKAAINEATTSSPILIDPNPKTMKDALINTLAFSYEGRQSQFRKDTRTMKISSMPRMRQ